jgi:hypothetical protein
MVDGWDLNEDKQQCTQVEDRFSVSIFWRLRSEGKVWRRK